MTFPMRRVIRAVVMSLIAATLVALLRVLNGEPPAPSWAQAAGFAGGILLGELIGHVLDRRRKSNARRRSLRLWAFGFGLFGAVLLTAMGLLGEAGWTASQLTLAAMFGGVAGSIVGAALAGVWNATNVGIAQSA